MPKTDEEVLAASQCNVTSKLTFSPLFCSVWAGPACLQAWQIENPALIELMERTASQDI